MKRSMKTLLLSGVAALLVMGTAAAPSMSYFTTYVSAKGSKLVELEEVKTTPKEEFDQDGKRKAITVQNTGLADCYVRVKAYSGNDVTLQFVSEVDEEEQPLWIQDENDPEGWYYYRKVLARGTENEQGEIAGELSKTLRINIERTPKEVESDFNVIVIQEAAPVLLDENGDPLPNNSEYAGWTSEYKVRYQDAYVDESHTVGGNTETNENEPGSGKTVSDETDEQP